MNQTRLFLIFAWLMVAMLLWLEWGKAHAPKPVAAPTQATAAAVPRMVPDAATTGIPQATQPQAVPTPNTQATAVTQAARVHVRTDVLDVVLTGGGLQQADLLRYPQTRDSAAQPVRLLSGDATRFYQAQTGWVGEQGHAAPAHDAAYTTTAAPEQVLAADAQKIEVPFVWTNPQGVTFNRVYTFTRGSYAVDVKDTAINGGTAAWAGYIYRQLVRVPPVIKTGYTHPESFSFIGATWFDAKEGYQRRPFKDFMEDGAINTDVTGGWLAMPQHHFLTAWVPQADQSSRYSLMQSGGVDGITARGPGFTLQPGQQAASDARLWVGPKDVKLLNALNVPGMNRAVDYSRFEIFALLGQGLFWLLSKLHALIGNWGWAIIGLVVLLKMVLFPLSNAQYKSSAKMRRVQPRMAQLKERYGDDKVKFQQAMMDLYKTEKINPMGGCLPIIPQMIIFMTLYWVLSEAVELRHAPWMGWIQDLTARDPYFVLPVLNAAIMFATQHMTPVPPGMDPMQQKMMKFMPVIFGGVLAFLPAGLVLYQVANGALGLLQQWYMLRKYGDKPEPKSVVVD
ncbi:membrane protein insertase YidC [Lysobacter sp. HDW10]|jgi:YidC/Oxa1 family membrane protein insertase|uniref:membrane protein insertase YidC n=1 Tax=Lysobacter sp. HDW10 TaxID=2714936 RepID=UPI00140E3D56|nr:membrane protein insertase YidC [Lysobacter sp. HDW10]QIK80761.1 membrane protein insertase YidC [Lysobacter sp. HDW10]